LQPHNNNQYLISGSYDKTITLWKISALPTHAPEAFFTGHKQPISALAISSDNQQLVSAAPSDSVKIWDLVTKKCIRTIKCPSTAISSVAISPCKTQIAVGCYMGSITVYDASTNKQTNILENKNTDSIDEMAFEAETRLLFKNYAKNTCTLWDIAQKKTVSTTPPDTSSGNYVLHKSPAGNKLCLSKACTTNRYAKLTWPQAELLALMRAAHRARLPIQLNTQDDATLKSFERFEQMALTKNFDL
jgi:FOG: WD40 repeat